MHFWFFLVAGILLCLMLICNCVMTIIANKDNSFFVWKSEQKHPLLFYRIGEILFWLAIVFIIISISIFIGTDMALLSKILYCIGLLCMAIQDILDLIQYIQFFCRKDKDKEDEDSTIKESSAVQIEENEQKEKENNNEAKAEKSDETCYEVK